MPTSLQQAYSSSSGYKNRVQFTTDSTFTVPAGVYLLKEIWGTGGGGAGGGGSSSAANGAGGGSAASTVIARDIAVRPGDIITIKVGKKGLGVAGAAGQDGGDTVVYRNFMPILKAKGGVGGATASNSGVGGVGGVNTVTTVVQLNNHGAALNATNLSVGGDGADGATNLTAVAGKIVKVFPANIGTVDQMFPSFPITVSNGGVGTGSLYGGGGGGCSAYGVGGNGANAPTSSSLAVQGGDAVNRGAGGGGASGGSSSLSIRGGHGQDGIVEIYY